jgi:hypothetical protein
MDLVVEGVRTAGHLSPEHYHIGMVVRNGRFHLRPKYLNIIKPKEIKSIKVKDQ